VSGDTGPNEGLRMGSCLEGTASVPFGKNPSPEKRRRKLHGAMPTSSYGIPESHRRRREMYTKSACADRGVKGKAAIKYKSGRKLPFCQIRAGNASGAFLTKSQKKKSIVFTLEKQNDGKRGALKVGKTGNARTKKDRAAVHLEKVKKQKRHLNLKAFKHEDRSQTARYSISKETNTYANKDSTSG